MTDASRPLVIVADDDEDIRLVIRINLELEGFEVREAADAEALLRAAHEHLPDVILLDGFLPGDDGWQLLPLLRSDEALGAIPVVMLSGMASDQYRLRALRAGAAAWVDKPFKPQALVAVVRAVAQGQRIGERTP